MSKLAVAFSLAICTGSLAEAACEPIRLDLNRVAYHSGGDRGGNAGDGAEIVFKKIALELIDWVRRSRMLGIDTGTVDREALSERLVGIDWSVCMIDEPVIVAGTPRTCRNSFDPRFPGKIECSAAAFLNHESDESRYALAFHELLGLAGAETTTNGEFDDRISRQILPFVGRRPTAYLSDTPVRPGGVATFVKNPIHGGTGLKFSIRYGIEGQWICHALGFSSFVEGGATVSSVDHSISHTVRLTDDAGGFELFTNTGPVVEIVCI